MPTRRNLHRAAHELESRFDRRRRSGDSTIVIAPYRGYGRPSELIVRGRVLAEKRISRASEAEPLWRNLVNTWRRFQSDEVPNALVRATYGDVVMDVRSDEEGYFSMRIHPTAIDRTRLWHEVQLELPELGPKAIAHVVIPPEDADFGVISDIDDTVLVTNATSFVGMARSVIRNAASRLPFEGVADLYAALHANRNPIFYVSSSPWNLYELLHDFMAINKIPHGPMLLQDWGIDENTLIIESHTTHKLSQINTLLDYYPSLRFVLIGDSGQHDPEIYLQVIQAHPGRILGAFIRDVTPDLRDKAVASIIEQSNANGVEMLYVRDSAEALEHARKRGWIWSAAAEPPL